MTVKLLLLTFAATLLFAATVRADPVSLTINPNPTVGTAGATIPLSVRFTNQGAPKVQIIDITISSVVGPGTAQLNTLNLGQLLSPVPLGFPASREAQVFSVTISPSARPGDEIVTTITVSYVTEGETERRSVKATSTIRVVAVPEPTTMLLLGTGLAAVALKTRKKVKQ